jgi:hypothetical protein
MPLSLDDAKKELSKYTPIVDRYPDHIKATILISSDSRLVNYVVDLKYTMKELLVEKAASIVEGFGLKENLRENWANNIHIKRKIGELRKLLDV